MTVVDGREGRLDRGNGMNHCRWREEEGGGEREEEVEEEEEEEWDIQEETTEQYTH